MHKVLILICAAASAALTDTPGQVWAQAPTDADRYAYGPAMMGSWSGMMGMMVFGPLFMILFLAVLVAIAVLLVRWLGGPWPGAGPPPPPSPGRTALDILKERFARGEIDKNEYEERRRILSE